MKIAFSTNNKKTISGHLGRAKYYKVFEIEDGKIIKEEIIEKPTHDHGEHEHEHNHEQMGHGKGKIIGMSMPEDFKKGNAFREYSHNDMVNVIADCKYVISRSMGAGAIRSFESANMKPIVTKLSDMDEAVEKFISGELLNENVEN